MALVTYTPPLKSRTFAGALFAEIPNDSAWRTALRSFEIRSVLDGFPPDAFEHALELGCGNGTGSLLLEPWCRRLTASDFDSAKFRTANTAKTTFICLDAQNLSAFQDESLNLVFSSNLLEHLPDVEQCLREIARVLKPGGYAVHLLPNRTWKIFNMLLFYPLLAKSVFMKLRSRRGRTGEASAQPAALDDNLRSVPECRTLGSRLLPRIHGCARSHPNEWLCWSAERWRLLFEGSGMQIERIVRLPFYFGYGYSFRPVLRLGNYLGLSSSTGYVMQKRLTAAP